jgi:hypothetical protein
MAAGFGEASLDTFGVRDCVQLPRGLVNPFTNTSRCGFLGVAPARFGGGPAAPSAT